MFLEKHTGGLGKSKYIRNYAAISNGGSKLSKVVGRIKDSSPLCVRSYTCVIIFGTIPNRNLY